MKKDKKTIANTSQIIIYRTEAGETKVDVRFEGDTVWLTQKQMAELFQTTIPNINMHIGNIFAERELEEISVIKDFLITASDGKNYRTKFYNLDMIISVGYRIKSGIATHFRQWATRHIKEYIIKGFVLNDERLKNPGNIFGQDYFDELIARIRDIRSSERRFYQKITDIYAQCSADYDPNTDITKTFFATVQNKLHWAITGQTAAELIAERANSAKEHMGLTTWKNAPKGSIRKPDVTIAKNYLSEKELEGLNRIVTMYLDYAENQAKKGVAMTMKDWVDKLDAFLQFNEEAVLKHQGKVSHEIAIALAETEFEKFRVVQDKMLESDFDKALKEIEDLNVSKNKRA